jgi:hypothetical protein
MGRPSQVAVMGNLSQGGVFLKGASPALAPNEDVLLRWQITGISGDTLRCHLPARVIWTSGRGAGLAFTNHHLEDARILRSLLARLGMHRAPTQQPQHQRQR